MSEFEKSRKKPDSEAPPAHLEELFLHAKSAEKLNYDLRQLHESLSAVDDEPAIKSHVEYLAERIFHIREMEMHLYTETCDYNPNNQSFELDLDDDLLDESDFGKASFRLPPEPPIAYTPESLRFFEEADRQAASLAAHPLVSRKLFMEALAEHRNIIAGEFRDAFFVQRVPDLSNLIDELGLQVRLPSRFPMHGMPSGGLLKPTLALARAGREKDWLVLNVRSHPEPDRIELELWNLRSSAKEPSILARNKDAFKSAVAVAAEALLADNPYSMRISLRPEKILFHMRSKSKQQVSGVFDKLSIQMRLKFSEPESPPENT